MCFILSGQLHESAWHPFERGQVLNAIYHIADQMPPEIKLITADVSVTRVFEATVGIPWECEPHSLAVLLVTVVIPMIFLARPGTIPCKKAPAAALHGGGRRCHCLAHRARVGQTTQGLQQHVRGSFPLPAPFFGTFKPALFASDDHVVHVGCKVDWTPVAYEHEHLGKSARAQEDERVHSFIWG